jgi:hypothetical protein
VTLGCPYCDHVEVVSLEDPDASLSDMSSHLIWRHNSTDPDDLARIRVDGELEEELS